MEKIQSKPKTARVITIGAFTDHLTNTGNDTTSELITSFVDSVAVRDVSDVKEYMDGYSGLMQVAEKYRDATLHAYNTLQKGIIQTVPIDSLLYLSRVNTKDKTFALLEGAGLVVDYLDKYALFVFCQRHMTYKHGHDGAWAYYITFELRPDDTKQEILKANVYLFTPAGCEPLEFMN